ncbi:putative NAD(+) ADP-ribosyltransferase [Helianthus anomalus]
MPRVSPDVDEQISSSFGSEDDVSIPVIEGYGDSSEDESEGDSSTVSDCESVVSGTGVVDRTGLVRLDESDKLVEIIEKKFVARLSYVGIDVRVEYIHRNMFNVSEIAQARLSSFQIYTKSVEKKNGGDANVKYAWFGGSKDEIHKIVVYGFGFDNVRKSAGFGHGVVLSADHSLLESVESATADEDGIKHILLCRVLLGKSELVSRGSTQCYPSSDDFQSGVDDLLSPKKLIVWSSQMNTHILPEFVISFKTLTSINRPKSDGVPVRHEKPVSPWIPIPDLIAALSKILAPKAIKEITQFRRSYIEHKISRREMIRGIREVTGDRLLLMILKDFTQQRQSNRLA